MFDAKEKVICWFAVYVAEDVKTLSDETATTVFKVADVDNAIAELQIICAEPRPYRIDEAEIELTPATVAAPTPYRTE